MAMTQTDLDALDEAIASGAMKVRYADKEVTYRSLREMLDLRERLRAEVAGTVRVRRRVGVMSRGF